MQRATLCWWSAWARNRGGWKRCGFAGSRTGAGRAARCSARLACNPWHSLHEMQHALLAKSFAAWPQAHCAPCRPHHGSRQQRHCQLAGGGNGASGGRHSGHLRVCCRRRRAAVRAERLPPDSGPPAGSLAGRLLAGLTGVSLTAAGALGRGQWRAGGSGGGRPGPDSSGGCPNSCGLAARRAASHLLHGRPRRAHALGAGPGGAGSRAGAAARGCAGRPAAGGGMLWGAAGRWRVLPGAGRQQWPSLDGGGKAGAGARAGGGGV